MKRLLNIIILILFCTIIIYPQGDNSFGIKIGLSISNLKYHVKRQIAYVIDPAKYFGNNSLNPTISLFYNYKINTNINIESELSYIQKGSRYTYAGYYVSEGIKYFTTGIDIRYLELGINIKPTININNFPTYLIIGPTLNYTLNVADLEHDLVKDIIYGYKVGVGTEIKNLIKIPLLVELKYIGDFSYAYRDENVDLRNQVIVIDLGLQL